MRLENTKREELATRCDRKMILWWIEWIENVVSREEVRACGRESAKIAISNATIWKLINCMHQLYEMQSECHAMDERNRIKIKWTSKIAYNYPNVRSFLCDNFVFLLFPSSFCGCASLAYLVSPFFSLSSFFVASFANVLFVAADVVSHTFLYYSPRKR